jgi:hypothetical protein
VTAVKPIFKTDVNLWRDGSPSDMEKCPTLGALVLILGAIMQLLGNVAVGLAKLVAGQVLTTAIDKLEDCTSYSIHVGHCLPFKAGWLNVGLWSVAVRANPQCW